MNRNMNSTDRIVELSTATELYENLQHFLICVSNSCAVHMFVKYSLQTFQEIRGYKISFEHKECLSQYFEFSVEL